MSTFLQSTVHMDKKGSSQGHTPGQLATNSSMHMEMNTNTATQPPPRHTTVHLALALLPSCRWQSNAPLTSPKARSNSHQRAQMACLKRAVTRRVHTQVHTHTHTHAQKQKYQGSPPRDPPNTRKGATAFCCPRQCPRQ